MEHSYRFFENKACKYFPCHQGLEDFNCLFCYCPLYTREHCPGNPRYMEKDGRNIKVCTNCAFPHQPENYDTIIQMLQGKNIDATSNISRKNIDAASDISRKNIDAASDISRKNIDAASDISRKNIDAASDILRKKTDAVSGSQI